MGESSNKFRFLIPLLSGLFAVIFLLCGVIYIIININLFKVDNIPIIKAPEGPIKEKHLAMEVLIFLLDIFIIFFSYI